ncbi:hypothetical protein [Pelosinus fermentans]|uniref:PsbP C-terminal domain-containing protein n=1 Tax=Pelosinus fermentans JBW45 TaxID=1192197 RepID=I9NR01_9FIRM|nr:hypothetical protein [Pelosinus fermentans]AJQ27525.1 hypothetical protein JBW_02177 [Pelosinus fermentans JBW45]
MKRIALLLILLFLSLPTTFAEQENIPAINDIFIVIFPEDWTIQSIHNLAMRGISPNKIPSATITFFENNYQRSLDDLIHDKINGQPASGKAKEYPIQLEEIQSLYIDNREARTIIYSGYAPEGHKAYYVNCYAYGDQYVYFIWITGKYDDLENDLKIFDDIISSIKILSNHTPALVADFSIPPIFKVFACLLFSTAGD